MAAKGSSEYMKVDNPLVLRRKVLETAIDSTKSLRFFEDYKVVRDRKADQIKKLRTLMRKIKREITAFNKLMPETKITEKLEEKEERKTKKIKGKPTKTKKARNLEEEISNIKSKLSNLGV